MESRPCRSVLGVLIFLEQLERILAGIPMVAVCNGELGRSLLVGITCRSIPCVAGLGLSLLGTKLEANAIQAIYGDKLAKHWGPCRTAGNTKIIIL